MKQLPREIASELGPIISLKQKCEKLAIENADEQGILKDARVVEESGDYYGKAQAFANKRCSIYQCHSCKVPYFGGLIDCEQEMANAEQNKTQKEDLLCQDCLLKEFGAGETSCIAHGTAKIDWKCMFCCSNALFKCFGTHFFCNSCHDEYNRSRNPPLKDCHGINCPLGIAHPPPNKDPKKGGVYPLGCGICRSEKLEKLQNRDIKQVTTEKNMPKAYLYHIKKREFDIIRPDVEIEVPDWFAFAEEIEEERIRILNKTPVPIFTVADQRRREKAMQKKMR